MADSPRSTRAILDLLGHSRPGTTLDLGSFHGEVARATGCTYLHVDLVACEAARAAGVATVLHSDRIPEGPFHTIAFDAREYDPALAIEMVAQAGVRLAPGGVLITTAPRSAVEGLFAEITAFDEALVAREPIPGAYRLEMPTYDLEVQGRPLQVQTAPGVFSPRGLDTGTRVMLSLIEAKPGARFLDLGCGAGVVSLVATEVWGCQVTAVDVNARALRMTFTNAPKAEVLASNGFAGLGDRQFDIVASNPPYHTDFSVGKAFIEGAYRHLAIGGTLYLVVKRSEWYEQRVRSTFGGCRVTESEGYVVITAEKREPKGRKPEAAPTTTKKHAKRMQQASRRH